jgi:hypothetical protein
LLFQPVSNFLAIRDAPKHYGNNPIQELACETKFIKGKLILSTRANRLDPAKNAPWEQIRDWNIEMLVKWEAKRDQDFQGDEEQTVRIVADQLLFPLYPLSGKGLARYRSIPVRFQPLPIRTAREDFPQAAHPVGFVERVMGRIG